MNQIENKKLDIYSDLMTWLNGRCEEIKETTK